MFEFFGLRKKASHTILVVDDEPNIVQTLKDRLEMNDFRVITACNGREGLETATREQPDIILLDVIMPIMDGLEMIETLRENEKGKNLSVIMLTARSQVEDITRANSCGIEDYIVKPFDLSELLEKIQRILEKKSSMVNV